MENIYNKYSAELLPKTYISTVKEFMDAGYIDQSLIDLIHKVLEKEGETNSFKKDLKSELNLYAYEYVNDLVKRGEIFRKFIPMEFAKFITELLYQDMLKIIH